MRNIPVSSATDIVALAQPTLLVRAHRTTTRSPERVKLTIRST